MKEGNFYWIKLGPDSEWEVAKFSKGFFYTTGSVYTSAPHSVDGCEIERGGLVS